MRRSLIERPQRGDPQKHLGTAASAVQSSAARRPQQARCACRTAEGSCHRIGLSQTDRSGERGVTIALVAVAMFSIIAMAGLSIDIGTLYEASAEAQRAADAGALAAARVISISGITGDLTPHPPTGRPFAEATLAPQVQLHSQLRS